MCLRVQLADSLDVKRDMGMVLADWESYHVVTSFKVSPVNKQPRKNARIYRSLALPVDAVQNPVPAPARAPSTRPAAIAARKAYEEKVCIFLYSLNSRLQCAFVPGSRALARRGAEADRKGCARG